MDGSGVAAGSDPLATFLRLRPLEFLPLSDSSYDAENDFTPSDNIVVVVPRSLPALLSSPPRISFREMSVKEEAASAPAFSR